MAATYAIIEDRIQKAITALNTCKNVTRAEVACEFDVPVQRLRFRPHDDSAFRMTKL